MRLLVLALIAITSRMVGAESLTVSALLSQRGPYDGKLVSVKGYLIREFECIAIFQSKVASEELDFSQAIWVNLNQVEASKEKGEYEIIGILNVSDHGHLGAYKASLDGVGYIKALK